tara:strand:+ start:1352 stop:1558 length:207 start_codon:yes stop_codon:yes gene_type:complete
MIKPSGKCDICKTNDAKYWFGNTSSATCENSHCSDAMEERFAEHCREMDERDQLRQEMIEAFGDPDGY